MSDHSPHFNPNFIEHNKEIPHKDPEDQNFRNIGIHKVPTNEYLEKIKNEDFDRYLEWANLISELEEQEQYKDHLELILNDLDQKYPDAKLNPSLVGYKGNGIYTFKGEQISLKQLEDEFLKLDELYKKPEGKFERIQSYGRGQD